jgi:feruloyl esterase
VTVVAALVSCVAGAGATEAASCESLATLSLRDVRIDVAQSVAAGAFQPGPGAMPNPSAAPRFSDLPAFCRVVATARPGSEAPITIEVWLPAPRAEGVPGSTAWNGRLRGVGNDGFYNAAPVTLGGLADGLRAGDVAVGSDGGRKGDASYILRGTEQLTNFNYRSAHEMTVAARALAAAYYGKAPAFAAVAECAGRGAIGLSSVQRYPADYDAVAVGEFIGDNTRHFANQWWVWQALHTDEASTIPLEKLPMIQRAAVAACDMDDGVADGLISDPPRCAFDPGVLQCTAGERADCLTAPQVTALRTIYAGARNPRTNAPVAPPLMRGGETNWTPIVGPKPNPSRWITSSTSCVVIQPGTTRHVRELRRRHRRGQRPDGASAHRPHRSRHPPVHRARRASSCSTRAGATRSCRHRSRSSTTSAWSQQWGRRWPMPPCGCSWCPVCATARGPRVRRTSPSTR